VLASDSGRPVKRARVFISAAELSEGRGLLTDADGVFDFTELPAGRYTVSVSKSGFISLTYGQRRPFQAGTPLQLGDGQQLRGVDFRLPRGGVISGQVLDEGGEPMAGVTVRAMRYEYLQGDRRLASAGTSQTDDRGSYRIWGLQPGEYYVNALARFNFRQTSHTASASARGAGPGRGGVGPATPRPGAAAIVTASPEGSDPDNVNYAPTYYPGVATMNDAEPVNVGLSQELDDVNFSMQLVPMANIDGRVTNPDGSAATSGNVNLVTDAASGRASQSNQIGVNFGGRIRWDGAFTVANIPPGRYLLRARGDDTDPALYATLPVTIAGGDIEDLTVVLQPSATLTGTVMFMAGGSDTTDPTQLRIGAPSTDQSAFGQQQSARLDQQARFTLAGVPSGLHLIRLVGNTHGWTLQSVTIGGRDVTDTPIEIRAGEIVSNIAIALTNKLTEIGGLVTDQRGQPATEYTVLAFPTTMSLWRPQARQILTARPDQTGRYRLHGLPSGEYYLTAVDPAEQGEWFEPAYLDEHRIGAARITLAEGDLKTQDLRVSTR
jgi:hypothetical protein